MLWVLFRPEKNFSLIALLPTEEYSIAELSHTIAKEFGVEEIVFDRSKPDG